MKKHPPKYDTGSALKKLREAGVSQRQAEAHVEVIADALQNVATKSDLKQMEKSLVAKINQGNKLLSQQMSSMKESVDMQMNFMKEGFDQQVSALKKEFSQQMEFQRDYFNQKMEKYFYKLLVLLPAMAVSLYALYEYIWKKIS